MRRSQLPGNTALKFHRNAGHGFSFLYPEWWHVYDIPDGKLFSPSASADKVATFLSVETKDVGTRPTRRDLPELRKAFLAGLSQVPGGVVENEQAYDAGYALGVEARQTYGRRRRWIRVLYRGTLQVRLVAQGATKAEFDRWLPSFDPAMTNFVFDGGMPMVGELAGPQRRASAARMPGRFSSRSVQPGAANAP